MQQHTKPAQQIRCRSTFDESGAGDTGSHNGAALQLSHAQRPELPCQPHGAPFQVAKAEVITAKFCLVKADSLQDKTLQAPVAAGQQSGLMKSSNPRVAWCTVHLYRQMGQHHRQQTMTC